MAKSRTDLVVAPPSPLHIDNRQALNFTTDSTRQSTIQHLDVAMQFIQERTDKKEVQPVWCATKNMLADIFTKALPTPQFTALRNLIMVMNVQDLATSHS